MGMFVFWLAAVSLTALALALLLPPLLSAPSPQKALQAQLAQLRRDHAAGRIDAARFEAERQRLAAELADALAAAPGPAPARHLAAGLTVAVPAAALVLYLLLGRPDALDPTAQRAAAAAPPAGGAESGVTMEQAVSGLEARLAAQPDDVDGWLLLARSYRAMQRFGDMRRASQSALTLAPASPDALVEHAEAITLDAPDGSERRFGAEARAMLERALAAEPQHQKALWLLGVAELQAQRPAQAADHWQRLRALLAPDDPVRARLDEQIALAQTQAGGSAAPGLPPAPPPSAMPTAPAAGVAMSGGSASGAAAEEAPVVEITLDIDPALRSRLAASDTLFVFARAPAGGPPLAIRRIDAVTLPLTLRLSAADRMLAGVQMQAGAEVLIGARVSRSGQAQAQPGDLEAEPARLTLADANTLALRIDRVVGE